MRRVVHGELAALVARRRRGPLRAASATCARTGACSRRRSRARRRSCPIRFGTAMAGDDAVVDEFLALGATTSSRPRWQRSTGKVQLTVKGDLRRGRAAARRRRRGRPRSRALRERSPERSRRRRATTSASARRARRRRGRARSGSATRRWCSSGSSRSPSPRAREAASGVGRRGQRRVPGRARPARRRSAPRSRGSPRELGGRIELRFSARCRRTASRRGEGSARMGLISGAAHAAARARPRHRLGRRADSASRPSASTTTRARSRRSCRDRRGPRGGEIDEDERGARRGRAVERLMEGAAAAMGDG